MTCCPSDTNDDAHFATFVIMCEHCERLPKDLFSSKKNLVNDLMIIIIIQLLSYISSNKLLKTINNFHYIWNDMKNIYNLSTQSYDHACEVRRYRLL